MAPIDLNLVRTFAAVHETGSFSAAGERLQTPRSTASRAIASLEDALGVTLFHRTTRRVVTTEEGLKLYARISPSLLAVETALVEVPERAEAPSGWLRVASTVDLGMSVLAPAAARFTARYPDVQIDLRLGDAMVDMTHDGIDLALRVSSGKLPGASSLVAQKVALGNLYLYASPAYLARRGSPRTPPELLTHDWLTLRGFSLPLDIPKISRAAAGSLRPRIVADDMFAMRELVRVGAGIAGMPAHLCDEDVAQGKLVTVLPQLMHRVVSLYLVHQGGRHLPRKVALFRDVVLEVLKRSTHALVPHQRG